MKPFARGRKRPRHPMSAAQRGRIKGLAGQIYGRDREGYEEMLQGQIGKTSIRGISMLEASLVITHLEKFLGLPPRPAPDKVKSPKATRGPQVDSPAPSGKPRISPRQLWEIRDELWPKVCRGADQKKALHSFLRRMKMPEDPEWLTLKDAQKVIEALKAMALREALKGAQAEKPAPPGG